MKDRRRKRSTSWAEFAIEAILLFLLGWIVAFAMLPLHHCEWFQAIDRILTDSLMRELARDQLIGVDKNALRFVFVDIGEASCRGWAEKKHTSCTLSMVTPRARLVEIVDAITRTKKASAAPRLVVFDIDLAPLPRDDPAPLPDDGALCSAVWNLAGDVSVVVLKPLVIDLRQAETEYFGFPSILENNSCNPATTEQHKKLWFATPLIDPDHDGLFRRVHAWDEIVIEPTHERSLIPGVGFLGAALLSEQDDALRRDFGATPQIDPREIQIGNKNIKNIYKPGRKESSRVDQISFSLPYQVGSSIGPTKYPIAPSQIETIEANTLDARLKDFPRLLDNAVVIVGGSYLASGDLHPTPLNIGMPGAMIHANAIRAYATGTLIVSSRSWKLKAIFITVAAVIGAASHVFSSMASKGMRPFFSFWTQLMIAFAGIFFSIVVLVLVGIVWAFEALAMTGTALGTLTPVLAVALEGVCTIFGRARDYLHEWLTSLILG
jgi:CHASE2 domain-containing sensor protein